MVDIAMDPEVAQPIIQRFDQIQDALEQMRWEPMNVSSHVETACGEFQGSVSDAMDAFHMAWRASLDTCGVTAGLIGANTNVFEVELTRIDADLAVVPDLAGGTP